MGLECGGIYPERTPPNLDQGLANASWIILEIYVVFFCLSPVSKLQVHVLLSYSYQILNNSVEIN
jgi:hypothetical protein